jgi:hypothetical protein
MARIYRELKYFNAKRKKWSINNWATEMDSSQKEKANGQ